MNFYWYSSVWYLDMFMHFLGGFWLSFAMIWFFKIKKITPKIIFEIILGVLFFSIIWEVFEIIVDKSITDNIFNILDTISDIFFDLAGGFSAMLYFSRKVMSIKENTI